MIGRDDPFSAGAIALYALAKHPELSDAEIGERLVKGLTKQQLAEFAVRYIASEAGRMRRSVARDAEQKAIVPKQSIPPVRYDPEAQLICEFERWRDSPDFAIGNRATRQKFREWMGEEAFAKWYQKGLALAQLDGERKAFRFEGAWWPKGRMDYMRMRHRKAVYDLIDEVSEQVELETTEELLATFFALGDGTKVSWGDATVEQHQQRIALLVKDIAGTTETAARHQAAIRMIEEAGVRRLADLGAAEGEHAA
jgi:hypothetical protein